MAKPLPSIETLRTLLRCDAETGKLYWRPRTLDMFGHCKWPERQCASWNGRLANKEALSVLFEGYKVGAIFDRNLRAHRVIWAMVHGAWPADQIDHINHDRSDNRIENLRCVTRSENMKNFSKSKANTSGVTGVYWNKGNENWNKGNENWNVSITINGKSKHIGCFTDKADAIVARKAAEIEHGFHKNHGK